MSLLVTSLHNESISVVGPDGDLVEIRPHGSVELDLSTETYEIAQLVARRRLQTVRVPRSSDARSVADRIAASAFRGPTQRRPAPSSISLRSGLRALWWPLDETSGQARDRVLGVQLENTGTVTQLYDNPGGFTLAADTALRLRDSAAAHEVLRLDNLVGSLVVGLEIRGATPGATGTKYAWGYGDAAQATGFYGGIINNSHFPIFGYRAVSGSLTQGNNQAGNLRTAERHIWHWVFHRHLLENRLHIECYVDGWIGRSERLTALEGAEVPPVDYVTRGLRIGARPSGPSGASTNFYAGQVAPQVISNFHVIRVEGDRRSMIPRWIENVCNTMPYGAIPEVLGHG